MELLCKWILMGGKKLICSSSTYFVETVIDNKIFKNTPYDAVFQEF